MMSSDLAGSPSPRNVHVSLRSPPHQTRLVKRWINIFERARRQVIDVLREHRLCCFVSVNLGDTGLTERRFEAHDVEVAGATLHVAVLDRPHAATWAGIERWIKEVAAKDGTSANDHQDLRCTAAREAQEGVRSAER